MGFLDRFLKRSRKDPESRKSFDERVKELV